MSQLINAEVIEQGDGAPMILIHSSVAGARQWRPQIEQFQSRYQIFAPNLYGYGRTPVWQAPPTQSLADHAALLAPIMERLDQPAALIGHSFGGSVAMKAAQMFEGQIDRLVLIEPNPFYLLDRYGVAEAFAEATGLCEVIKAAGAKGDWMAAAEVFANYWTGAGSWDAMPQDRREKFAAALAPNYHEWDCVMDETTSMAAWDAVFPKKTTMISARDTVGSIKAIAALFEQHVPRINQMHLDKGGHMAVMMRPDLVMGMLEEALS